MTGSTPSNRGVFTLTAAMPGSAVATATSVTGHVGAGQVIRRSGTRRPTPAADAASRHPRSAWCRTCRRAAAGPTLPRSPGAPGLRLRGRAVGRRSASGRRRPSRPSRTRTGAQVVVYTQVKPYERLAGPGGSGRQARSSTSTAWAARASTTGSRSCSTSTRAKCHGQVQLYRRRRLPGLPPDQRRPQAGHLPGRHAAVPAPM